VEQEYEPLDGGESCMWGGPSMASEDLPEINVVFFAASTRERHTERRRKQQLPPGCTREPVSGVGDPAFAEVCERSIPSASVYAQAGNADVVVYVYHLKPMSKASVKPAAIALAKAAAARAKSM
jgi:hypothetical protein